MPAFDRRVQRRGAERPALEQAQRARRSARRRGALAVLTGASALLSALVAGALGWLDVSLASASWVASAVWFMAMLLAWVGARRARTASSVAEERAWTAVAGEAVNSFPAVTERNVGELLGVPPSRAEQLLTQLVREDQVESEIDDHARVVYRRPRIQAETLKLRIGEDDLSLSSEEASEREEEVKTEQRSRV
ncbi:MAG: hypothetical protein KC492_06090 [Myxococcales bacterium]|nr:hypothetical protein [Myxococcales bacterium]MCB9608637.1 hypothetical protein [Polyangiaceae bacterium]